MIYSRLYIIITHMKYKQKIRPSTDLHTNVYKRQILLLSVRY